MEITIFRKSLTTKAGKQFYKYIGSATTKNGEKRIFNVKFNDGVKIPVEYPCVVEISKNNANMSEKTRKYINKDGIEQSVKENILWVKMIDKVNKYVDTSLDDFD